MSTSENLALAAIAIAFIVCVTILSWQDRSTPAYAVAETRPVLDGDGTATLTISVDKFESVCFERTAAPEQPKDYALAVIWKNHIACAKTSEWLDGMSRWRNAIKYCDDFGLCGLLSPDPKR